MKSLAANSIAFGILLLCPFYLCRSSSAQAPHSMGTASEYLPDTVVAYVELAPSSEWGKVELVDRLFEKQVVQEFWRKPQVVKARGGLALAEFAVGMKLTTLARDVAAKELVVALDGDSEGVVLMARAIDSVTLAKHFKRALKAARDDVRSKGKADSIQEAEYRGVTAYKLDQLVVAVHDEWLVVTNKGELGKKIVDHWVDGVKGSLAERADFRSLRAQETGALDSDATCRLAWGWVDLRALRQRTDSSNLFRQPKDNFAAELLIGGLLAATRTSPAITGTLISRADGIRFNMAWHETRAEDLKDHEFYFGASASGQVKSAIVIDGCIASLAVFRDVGMLWRRAGDLFDIQTNDRLAQADTTLTTLFSGKDFGEEILPAMAPELQVIVLAPDPAKQTGPTPAIQLPSAALVTRLRDAAVMAPQLRRIFQSLIGFVNITGSMNGQPQLDLDIARGEGGSTVVSATYAVDSDRAKGRAIPIQYNFSPTLVLKGDWAILASSTEAGRLVLEKLRSAEDSASAEVDLAPLRTDVDKTGVALEHTTNAALKIQGAPILAMVERNREQLISQNILEKGHSREEAIEEIDTVFDLLRLMGEFSLRIESRPRIAVSAELTIQE